MSENTEDTIVAMAMWVTIMATLVVSGWAIHLHVEAAWARYAIVILITVAAAAVGRFVGAFAAALWAMSWRPCDPPCQLHDGLRVGDVVGDQVIVRARHWHRRGGDEVRGEIWFSDTTRPEDEE